MSGRQPATSSSAPGPSAYENWRAAVRGQALISWFEVPLSSDAHFTGETEPEVVPYRLLNLISANPDKTVRPRVVLRASYHLERSSPPKRDAQGKLELKTDDSRYFGGWFEDELVALWSLALGVRLIAGNRSREWNTAWANDPLGRPVDHGERSSAIVSAFPRTRVLQLPETVGINAAAPLVARYPLIGPRAAVALVRAARSYQQALWIADSDPNLAWLLFVSAIETAAEHWRGDGGDMLEAFKAAHPSLVDQLPPESLETVAKYFLPISKSTVKFLDFTIAFMPSPPDKRPLGAQVDWSPKSMRFAMRQIYKYRSRALHASVPFPPPMCQQPNHDGSSSAVMERPWGLASHSHDGTWAAADIPMHLHVFEHITRGALTRWWLSLPAHA